MSRPKTVDTKTGKSRKSVPGRPVARFSNLLEAIGAVVLLAWGVTSFPLGHPILGVILLVLGLFVSWVTVREFMGHGLGKAPNGSPDDSKN
ncbi:MAG: hypothetical protein ACTIJJ_03115 [Galactobacter sp.]|uniref:hypothetical protein n=1 Tax=Galactobacter sp. TaxID=2676125 RepID=UPI0025BB0F3E|nr:hypothetical protein [Galactobacter sp.]